MRPLLFASIALGSTSHESDPQVTQGFSTIGKIEDFYVELLDTDSG